MVDPLFAGKKLLCLNQYLLTQGGHCSVFRGLWKENGKTKNVAIRRVRIEDCHEKWKDTPGSLNHDNVLKVIGYEEVPDEYRYFATEYYVGTLEQFCNGQYMGPMPSNAQVLCQIANGINYLHIDNLPHGHLNPRTILISQSQPVRMKISDSRLSKFTDPIDFQYTLFITYNNRKNINYLPELWMLDGSWRMGLDQDGNRVIIPTATVYGDVFAAGCLFFYFLTRGSHPFGDDVEFILDNIRAKNPVNLNKLHFDHFAYEPIKQLIGKSPKNGEQWLHGAAKKFASVLPLQVDETKKLGSGSFGTVFAGTYEGNEVAVKKIPLDKVDNEINLQREMELHKQLDHQNVLQLLHIDEEKDPKCKYIALELCEGTLTQYCDQRTCEIERKRYLGPDRLPPDVVVLYQIALGLHYIHSKDMVHRDVKPDNILVSLTTPVQTKLSDFGYCKRVSRRGTFSQSGLKGTLNWMAPEMLENLDVAPDDLPRGTIESDTFSAGCVFFYLLTRGSIWKSQFRTCKYLQK